MSRIHLSAPDLRGLEIDYVTAAIQSGWLAPAGPDLAAFEEEIGAWAEGRHAVGLSSGTAALHLALVAAGVEPGDDVLCSTLTFVATANSILQAGARPVFVDSEAASWNIDPGLVEEELKKRAEAGRLPSALVTVDLYGQCCDYEAIVPICEKYGVTVIEDAAEGLGAKHKGRFGGSFGKIAVLSFNGNKIITASGGGMLLTDDADIADRVRYLSTQAREPAPHYEHVEQGYNYRLSNILAALGRAQLKNLPERIERRRDFNRQYRALLEGQPGFDFMPEAAGNYTTFWLTCLTIDPAITGISSESIRLGLEDADIESRPVWKPMHLQPIFAENPAILNGVSDRLFEQGLCLPSGSGMTDEQFDRVLNRLGELVPGVR